MTEGNLSLQDISQLTIQVGEDWAVARVCPQASKKRGFLLPAHPFAPGFDQGQVHHPACTELPQGTPGANGERVNLAGEESFGVL